MKLELYEDVVKNADKALSIDPKHLKSVIRKANGLAYLRKFDESFRLLKSIDTKESKEAIEDVNHLKEMHEGNYKRFLENF
jgi:DNA-binding transcriptional regulator WhiA